MGEKQIRAQADKVGADALRPMFDALADLAVAVDAASRRDEVRAQARERAERIMADAEAEIGRRDQHWRDAWQAALAAGWTAAQLRADPINMAPPHQPRRRGGSRAARSDQPSRAEGITQHASVADTRERDHQYALVAANSDQPQQHP